MAFPPLDIDESVPGDSDIVSQFPAAERTFRADLEDFLLVDHQTDGHHKAIALDFMSDPAGVAGYTTIWADTSGELNYRIGTGTVAPLLPPGMVVPFAGTSAPEGWLLCAGQAVSRTTYAALFAAIGTTYGSGDGSTTFNLPDLRGRVPAGKESTATRLTAAIAGLDGATLGATGGDQRAQDHTHGPGSLAGITNTTGAHTHTLTAAREFTRTNATGNNSQDKHADDKNITTSSDGSHFHTVTITSGVTANPGGTKHGGNSANVQPTIILNYIIKW